MSPGSVSTLRSLWRAGAELALLREQLDETRDELARIGAALDQVTAAMRDTCEGGC
jgi:hypothetical protein